MGKSHCREFLSGVSRKSFISISLSNIITAFPIKLFSLRMCIIMYSIFNSLCSLLTFLFSASSSLLVICTPSLLYLYFLPFPPSFFPTLWQPRLVQLRLPEPGIYMVQGRRWGTWGLDPLAKTASPAVAWCLPLLTLLSPRHFALFPKYIALWSSASFHSSLLSLSPNLKLSSLTWNGNPMTQAESLKLTVVASSSSERSFF